MSTVKKLLGLTKGIPLNGLVPLNSNEDLLEKEDGTIWLKTGVLETNASLYPGATGITGDAYDITKLQKSGTLAVTGAITNFNGLGISSDGTRLYVDNKQYVLSDPFNLSSATLYSTKLSTEVLSTGAGYRFSSDGLTMYILNSSYLLKQVALAEAWNPCSSIYQYALDWSAFSAQGEAYGFSYSNNGMYCFVSDITSDLLGRAKLPYPFAMGSLQNMDQTINLLTIANNGAVQSFRFSQDGTKGFGVGQTQVFSLNFPTPWDLTGATIDRTNFQLSSYLTTQGGGTVSQDGKWLYVLQGSTTSTKVDQIRLTIPNDLKTISLGAGGYYVNDKESNPSGVCFSADGTNIYVVGSQNDKVYQYTTSKPYRVDFCEYLQEFSIATQDILPKDIRFSADGLIMYILGDTNNTVYQYSLSTAWNISTSVINTSFSIAAKTTAPRGLSFSSDGTKMYILDSSNIHQYTLSTAWLISSSSFLRTLASPTNATSPYNLKFSTDGLKLFLAHNNNDLIEYSLSEAWNISTTTYVSSTTIYSGYSAVLGLDISPDGVNILTCGAYLEGTIKGHIGTLRFTTPWLGTSIVRHNVGRKLLTTFTGNYGQELMLSPDGTRLIVGCGGFGNMRFSQCNLSVPFDIESLVDTGTYFTLLNMTGGVWGFDISPDGRFATCTDTQNVRFGHYYMSTPWEVSTMSIATPPTKAVDGNYAFTISDSGTELYTVVSGTKIITQYHTNTPWNMLLATTTGNTLNISTKIVTDISGISISSDGTILTVTDGHISNSSPDTIYNYTLTTPWNISTAVYTSSQTFITGESSKTSGLVYSPDGRELYIWDYPLGIVTNYTILPNTYLGFVSEYKDSITNKPIYQRIK